MMSSYIKIVLLALLGALPMQNTVANPVGCWNCIGLFADMEGYGCEADFPLYVTTEVHVLALLPYEIEAITAAEFLVSGVQSAPEVIITPTWHSSLVIGDALGGVGFSIAWQIPQAGPIVHIGDISFFVIGDWPGDDALWCTRPTNDSGKLVVVDDDFIEHDVYSCCFVANCTPNGPFNDCGLCFVISTEEVSWSKIRTLY